MRAAGLERERDWRPVIPDDALRVGPLELWHGEQTAFVDGQRVELTPREFGVLWALAQRAGHVVAKATVMADVWPDDARSDRIVDAFVRKLRVKLAEVSPGLVYVHTHQRRGYRFEPEERG